MHGRRGVVQISGATIAKVTAYSYEEKADSVDATSMGDTGKSYDLGLVDGSGTIDFRFLNTDYAVTEGQGIAKNALRAGTSVTLKLQPDSAITTGEFVALSGTVVVNSYSINQSFDDTINGSFAYQGVLTSYSG